MKRSGIVLFALFFVALEARAGTGIKWELDKGHSYVGFSVRHLGITNVRGEFEDYEAVIHADPTTGKVTTIEATAKADSVDTGIEGRDNHLKSDDFFNAKKYPTLKLKSKSIEWKGNEVSGVATVTIRNVSKDVKFTGKLIGTQKVNFGDGDQLRAGYELTATINRQDFGLKFNRMAEGVSVVSNQVEIVIEAQASRRLVGQS